MQMTKSVAVALVASSLLLGGPILATAEDAHHSKDAPKAAESAPAPKTMEPGQAMETGKMAQAGQMGMMGNCPMMGGTPKSLDAMKAELGITDAQASVWDTFAAIQAKSQTGMQDMRKTMMKMMEGTSPVARLDAHIDTMDKHLASLKSIQASLKALYSVLSDDQKKKASSVLGHVGCMM